MSTTSFDPTPTVSLNLAGTLMTPEEFDAIQDFDEEYRYELIGGLLVVVPPPSTAERGPNDMLGHLLIDYAERHSKGAAMNFTTPEHTVATAENRRRADRAIWAGLGRFPDVRRDLPTMIVEFVSAGRRNRERDYETKRHEYLDLGVAEYWIIDRFRRTMTVWRADPQSDPTAPPTSEVIGEDGSYKTALLPGFELPLARLLAVSDRLPPDA